MTIQSSPSLTVIRTSRGLSIAGTRITLYTILDYLHAGWPPKLIQEWLDLSPTQMADVVAYLEAHRDTIEQEYQQVVQQAEERRHYWETYLQQHRMQHGKPVVTPAQAELRAKFQAWKEQRRST